MTPQIAHSRVATAIKRGVLIKKPCERCGDEKSEGHHEDYDFPLDVIWLCRKHHKIRHQELGWGGAWLPPSPQDTVAHIRIYDPLVSTRLGRLAEINRRSKQSEGLLAIELHIEANRTALKNGSKLPKGKAK